MPSLISRGSDSIFSFGFAASTVGYNSPSNYPSYMVSN